MAPATPKSVSYKFKWIIENATRENIKKRDRENPLECQTIQTWFERGLVEWFVSFYYNAETKSVSLFFHKKAHTDNILLNFRVKLQTNERSHEQTPLFDSNLSLGWPEFLEFESLLNPTNKYIDEENCLTLNIEADFTETWDDADKLGVASSIPTDPYSQFFNNKTLSDFTFKCSDGVELPVHRFCLAAHSEVFMKMFTVDMEEKNSNLVVFKDISSVTMKTALKFIYTKESVYTDVESTIKVLDVAEKYEFPELKQNCIGQLMTHVDAENVLEVFEAADLYGATLLEKKCLPIIIENYEKLKITEKFKQLEMPLVTKIIDELTRIVKYTNNLTVEDSF